MYTLISLKKIVNDQIAELTKRIEASDKIKFQLKLLKNILESLEKPRAESIVNAFNCLEDGGDLPYLILRALLSLSDEASCGHFVSIAVLNFSKVKIDFLFFIDLMTQGTFLSEKDQLSTLKDDFIQWIPEYKEKPQICYGTKDINKDILIEKLSLEPNGLYSFKGFNIIKREFHRFMIIKIDKNFYYACSEKEGAYSDAIKKTSSMFPDFKDFCKVEGNYIKPLNSIIAMRAQKRIEIFIPSVKLSHFKPISAPIKKDPLLKKCTCAIL